MSRARVLLLSTFLTIPFWIAAQGTFPQPSGRINDFAGLLDDAAEAELDALVLAVDNETSIEIAVATVTSLGGMSVEEYALGLFDAWGVGKQGRDNGVLVLVAANEREMRIEVGYGLEPILPDGLAGAIVRDEFLPRFRDGNYQAGIVAGVQRLAGIARRNQPLTDEERRALQPGGGFFGFLALLVGLAILGTLGGGGGYMIGTGVSARIIFYTVAGVVITAAGIGLAWQLPRPVLIGEILFVALFVWLGVRHTRRPGALEQLRGSNAGTRGWVGAGARGSGGSGGSSGSSSSSFGGGRSGGGGASGRW